MSTVMQQAIAKRAKALVEAMNLASAASPADRNLTIATDVMAPEFVRRAAKDALDAGHTHYTARPGVVELRTAIAERSTTDGFPASAGRVIVTNGASEALYIIAQHLFTRGSDVFISGPVSSTMLEMIKFVGATPVFGDSSAENLFFGTVSSIKESNAIAVLISSPSPMTGLSLTDEELTESITAALDSGKRVILDRSLETSLFEPRSGPFESEVGDRIVTVGSFSTGHGLRGWRVGWLTAPTASLSGLANIKQAMSICTTAVSQYAALAALKQGNAVLAERRDEQKRRLDAVTSLLDAAGIRYLKPCAYGSFFIAIPASTRQALTDAGIVVEAGEHLIPSAAGYVRVDLNADGEALISGITQLAAIVGGAV